MAKGMNPPGTTVGNQVRNMAARLHTLEAIVRRHGALFEDFAAAVEQHETTLGHLMATHVHELDDAEDDEP